ncbi:RNA polymerase sigma-70 factor [Hallella bergensis DSM 17361]|uniref:RNA polymerase sigma-70 factor n=1 Tax=Hallella bergensis DSM 17361 TaxID=585502 RepID=D1PVX2_9BACT|nr:sigma-70 family RNA polymerase sigma factor [Hallella bergensis]EFA44477.1 RNA polymerase sigma-70 factor [Hallella bergensis DSM 17361]
MNQYQKEQCFEELFQKNYSKMYYLALYILKNTDDAQDVVHEVFAKLWEEYNPEETIYKTSYFTTITRNRCLDIIKHDAVKMRYARLYIEMYRQGLLDDDTDGNEQMDVIYKTMEKMSPRTRLVVEQCYFENMKYAEVADLLGLSKDGVRKHIIKALAMLRKAFPNDFKKK